MSSENRKPSKWIIPSVIRLLSASMLWDIFENIGKDGIHTLVKGFYLGFWAGIIFNGLFVSLAILAIVLPFRISSQILTNRIWFVALTAPISMYIIDEAWSPPQLRGHIIV